MGQQMPSLCGKYDGCRAQIRFFEVSEAELGTQRELFRTGRMEVKFEDVEFSMKCGPWLHYLIHLSSAVVDRIEVQAHFNHEQCTHDASRCHRACKRVAAVYCMWYFYDQQPTQIRVAEGAFVPFARKESPHKW